MPLIVDGVIIPEDKANALNFNGVNIEKVIFNGVEVWKQSLFSAVWGGSSLAGGVEGLSTSGSLARMETSTTVYGVWVSVDSNGIFETKNSRASSFTISEYRFANNTITTYWQFTSGSLSPTSVYLDNGFWSGSCYSQESGNSNYMELQTSGGLIRAGKNGIFGIWISLT